MKVKNIITILAITGVVLALLGIQTAQADLTDANALEERGYIAIWRDSGDHGFDDMDYSGVTDGNGTEEYPYIIENWDIDATKNSWTYNTGIWVQDTTKHFVIRNVWVHNGGVGGIAIYFSNLFNGVIENCRVTKNNDFGILLTQDVTNVVIQDSNVTDNGTAICLNNASNYNTVTNNDARDSTVLAISIQENSCYNTATGNTASDSQSGITVSGSHNNTISDNIVSSNVAMGITVGDANDNTISGNTCSYNGFDGICLGHGSNNVISGNTACSNEYRGIWLGSDANDNIMYDNYLAYNKQGNACDWGVNAWNIEKTSGRNIVGGPYLGGNYYIEYIGVDIDGDRLGDTPYLIFGGTSLDMLPLLKFPGDIAPPPYGDGIVDFRDFALLAGHWLAGIE